MSKVKVTTTDGDEKFYEDSKWSMLDSGELRIVRADNVYASKAIFAKGAWASAEFIQ
jgi:hypothetical protein